MYKLTGWLDEHLLPIYTQFLLIFIPLYPKLPLFDVLPGYIVRVRLEDFLIAGAVLIWLFQLLRGRVKLSANPLVKWMAVYLLAGIMSVISALFIAKSVPLENIHIAKVLFHFGRRIEYFSLFFIFFSSVKSMREVLRYFYILAAVVLAVALYGFGQKYLYWPAFFTMNREFAKGWMLYLTEHARVLSTFGGHYDLAAFVMMALILLWSLFFSVKKLFFKVAVFLILSAAFWTLILTASRTSFLAYLAGLFLMFAFWSFRKGITWSLKRYMAVTVLSIVVMLSFGDLSERFTKFLKLDQRLSGIKSLLMLPIGKPPSDKAYFLENRESVLNRITSKSDQPPSLGRPSDVTEDIPISVKGKDGRYTQVPRTYSKTAFVYDLSTAIRIDALWPRAIAGFKKNLLFGSGYSTLNKIQINEFTEAESTDNDYLRALGETGLFGFITFYGMLLFMLYYVWRHLVVIREPLFFAVSAGFVGLIFGLMVNAVYIDVFESSKVAQSFWALSGLVLAGVSLAKGKNRHLPWPSIPDTRIFFSGIKIRFFSFLRSDFFYLSLIVFLAFSLRVYKIGEPLADWHSWRQADTSAVTRNFVKNGVNLLFPVYDDLSNIASGRDNPKGYRFVEFPLYNFAAVAIDRLVVGYHLELKERLTSVFASLAALIFIFLTVRKYNGRRIAYFSAFFFAVLPYNVFFSRTVLPEPFLVFTSTAMLYFLDKAFEFRSFKRILLLAISLLFAAAAVLVKPFAVFLFLPLTYLWFKNLKIKWSSIVLFLLFLAIAISPYLAWRVWSSNFPEGIPANSWLLNGDGIRFKGAFFQWLFAERLGKLILGFYGLPLLILGILAKRSGEGFFYYLWGLAILLYVTVFATGNVRHDYYQILTVPIIAIFLAKGSDYLLQLGRQTGRLKAAGLLSVLILFMLMFSWYHIRDFYNINHPEIVEAGRKVDTLTPPNSLVIAPYNGDTAFLYQTHRAGWPVMQKTLPEMIKMGAHYYVSVNYDQLTNELIQDALQKDESKRNYKLVARTDKYAIIQLVADNKLPK